MVQLRQQDQQLHCVDICYNGYTVPSSGNLKITRRQTACRLTCTRGWHDDLHAVQPRVLHEVADVI